MSELQVSDTSTYLEAQTIDKDTTVAIEAVRSPGPADIGTGGKPMSEKSMILKYKNASKEHVIPRVVQKSIRALYGNSTSGWVGKKITLYYTTCSAFGNPKTPCIRVRNINPDTGEAPEAW